MCLPQPPTHTPSRDSHCAHPLAESKYHRFGKQPISERYSRHFRFGARSLHLARRQLDLPTLGVICDLCATCVTPVTLAGLPGQGESRLCDAIYRTCGKTWVSTKSLLRFIFTAASETSRQYWLRDGVGPQPSPRYIYR